VIHGLSLVSDLKTGAAHSVVHCVHVDLTREWLIFSLDVHIGFLILEEWDLDANLFLSTFSDALGYS
jgi:hypothetical protein